MSANTTPQEVNPFDPTHNAASVFIVWENKGSDNWEPVKYLDAAPDPSTLPRGFEVTESLPKDRKQLVKFHIKGSPLLYNRAVMVGFNQLAMGEVPAKLPALEAWLVTQPLGLTLGGSAVEVAFDALRKFGMTVEEIQTTL